MGVERVPLRRKRINEEIFKKNVLLIHILDAIKSIEILPNSFIISFFLYTLIYI